MDLEIVLFLLHHMKTKHHRIFNLIYLFILVFFAYFMIIFKLILFCIIWV